jgi:diadenylate cyclase
VLAVAYGLAYVLQLGMIVYLIGLIFSYGAIALLVVFAPELRAALAQIGRSPMSRFLANMRESEIADAVAEAVERLSRSGIGAIIAIEREVSLDEYVQSGSEMHAKVSADLLATIFTPYSPLHDGAVIIRGDTIVGAGCILPLSQTSLIDRSLGTRHRAALGLSEETDALVIVVSEETATISAAQNGRLARDVTAVEVREVASGRSLRQLARHAEAGLSS